MVIFIHKQEDKNCPLKNFLKQIFKVYNIESNKNLNLFINFELEFQELVL